MWAGQRSEFVHADRRRDITPTWDGVAIFDWIDASHLVVAVVGFGRGVFPRSGQAGRIARRIVPAKVARPAVQRGGRAVSGLGHRVVGSPSQRPFALTTEF